MNNAKRLITNILVVLVLLILPFILKKYHLNMVTEIVIFALYAVSYNLLLGYAGLLSFGHAMFFGLAAFVTGIAIIHLEGIGLLTAVVMGVFSAFLASAIIGSLLLRHKGSYFALLTLAFNALFYAVATKWHSITGGDDGLSVPRPVLNVIIAKIPVESVQTFYYLTLIVIGVAILFSWFFTKTAMGKTVLLMRENEERMKFVGYSTNLSRLILFIFTGTLAGLAGSFYTLHFRFVSISAISVEMTTIILLMTFVGGTKTFWGPILGTFVYIILQNYLSDITDRWPLFMGLIFIFMVLFIPGGLSGLIMDIRERLAKNRSVVVEGSES
ncbi:MAG TPA: branched-chain amino acid ABC transporter permease [Syntrophales bacterium]|nr:branched-chain amino acid ABC transporter permease [Syntrophales bacterium]HOL59366.1 branched-chain amino acid ABC transporter permease [Syntrophales bacterium]HPO35523.1 branched-chain amino acid ABC transporter permease [Syntrophales bacterium]